MGESVLPTDYARAALASIGKAVQPVGLEPPRKLATIAHGLTEAEFTRIEEQHSFAFPPDLRSLLAVGLPTGKWFPNWRDGSVDEIRELLRQPIDGVLFDVANGAFWFAPWGSRPPNITDAVALASERLQDVPVLVPIFLHRCIPSRPHESGNPVLSVMQTDIIYYGTDLPNYLAVQFDAPRPTWSRADTKRVPFWSDLIDLNNQ